MAIFGVRFATKVDRATLEGLSPIGIINFLVFFFHHSMFAIMCLTLLVRLLMAMMTNTFQSVKKSALLEWRLLIARAVLRYEHLFFFAPQAYKLAGEKHPDGKFYHNFLHVAPDADGHEHIPLMIARRGAGSLFASADDMSFARGGQLEEEQQQQSFIDDEKQHARASFERSASVTSGPLLRLEHVRMSTLTASAKASLSKRAFYRQNMDTIRMKAQRAASSRSLLDAAEAHRQGRSGATQRDTLALRLRKVIRGTRWCMSAAPHAAPNEQQPESADASRLRSHRGRKSRTVPGEEPGETPAAALASADTAAEALASALDVAEPVETTIDTGDAIKQAALPKAGDRMVACDCSPR